MLRFFPLETLCYAVMAAMHVTHKFGNVGAVDAVVLGTDVGRSNKVVQSDINLLRNSLLAEEWLSRRSWKSELEW